MHDDPFEGEPDEQPDELDDDTMERVAAARRPSEGGGARYEEEPGMGEDEHGEQPSR